ncbi:protein FAM163B-like [Carassius auratus]|uniref:Protein FAM163B-like n=1 Tax=Carassius auratus TaxID=7957 RepID=A0A6P6Q6U0_CARAU|nr:protein FAM163B-like [Carassius auratus]XP_026129132.1 protein FAM163B-like [Carassius auratus]XP_026129156.1 protein FAM163B-like [Carassius auratus]XP_026129157.1 protein FAM163B-like [Carassius auratus]
MTAGTVVITGGILATVILLCIIAVLCYCRLQYYCCKKEESESEEEEPDFAVTSRMPPVHSNHNILAATVPTAATPNGPALFTPPPTRKLTRSQTYCPSCTHYDLPFYLQQPDGLRNGGERISYRSVHQQDLGLPTPLPAPLPSPLPTQLPMPLPNYHKLNLSRSVTMREMFTRSCSISTDV